MDSPVPIGIAIGTLCSFFQAMAVVDSFEVNYPNLVDGLVMSPVKIFALDIAVVGVPADCISGKLIMG